MEQLKEWFNGLEDNEQRIVIIGGVVLSLVILIFGLIKPLNDSVNSLRQQVDSRQKSVANWKASMPVLIANRGATNTATNSRALSNVITSTTRRFNLNVSRVQEKGQNEMQVWFDNVPFNDFIRWVAELENKHQVTVDSVNIRSKERDGLSSIDIKIIRG